MRNWIISFSISVLVKPTPNCFSIILLTLLSFYSHIFKIISNKNVYLYIFINYQLFKSQTTPVYANFFGKNSRRFCCYVIHCLWKENSKTKTVQLRLEQLDHAKHRSRIVIAFFACSCSINVIFSCKCVHIETKFSDTVYVVVRYVFCDVWQHGCQNSKSLPV